MEYCNGCPISFIQRYHSLFPIKMARKKETDPIKRHLLANCRFAIHEIKIRGSGFFIPDFSFRLSIDIGARRRNNGMATTRPTKL